MVRKTSRTHFYILEWDQIPSEMYSEHTAIIIIHLDLNSLRAAPVQRKGKKEKKLMIEK